MATSIAAPSLQNLLVNTWTNVYSAAPVAGFTGTVRVVVEVGSGSLKLSNISTGVTYAAGYGNLYNGSASSIAFEGNLTQVNDALQSLQAYNSDANASPTLKISAVKGGPAYNPVNGHYYEYIDYTATGLTDKTWTGAQGYAANSVTKFNGLQGYLVTITSQQENDFIVGKVGGNAWIGANDAAVEGTWRWVTGPEAGTLIMTEPGDGANPIDSESPFYSWQTGEPNNGGGTEDYAQLISSGAGGLVAGRWNDLVNTGGGEQYTVTGFVIEYGGYSDDNPTEVARTTTTTLTVQATPVITSNGGGDSATVSYAENGNSAITTVTASDADTGDSKTYSITGGADAALFNINSTGELTFKDSPNYEAPSDNSTDNSYEVKVRVTDSSDLFDEQTLTVNVTDVNDNAPVFTSGDTGTVTENAATSTVIYDAATTDADSTGANQAIAYGLKGDGSADDAELLTINSSTGEVTLKASANFEAKNSYAFTVVATNAGTGATLMTEQAVSVRVTDVNETPAIAAGGSTAFTEQTPTAVAPAITLRDDDGNWGGGTLKVQITTAGSPDDSLILPTTNPGGSGIWLDVIGGNLLMSGTTQIGTANGSSANGGAPFPWVFTFDSNATNDLVQDVARAVQLTNSSNDPTTTARTVTFTGTDAANATASAIQTVTVTPVNDAPQVSNRVDPAVVVGENVYASFADANTGDNNSPTDIDASIASSQAFTLETWVRFDSLEGVQFIAGKTVEQMELHTNGNALRFIPTGGAYIDTGAVLVTGEWIHIAATYDASNDTFAIYINGVQVTSQDNNGAIDNGLTNTNNPYQLGLRSGGSYPLNGAIAEYRIWDSVRTEAEIRDNRSISLQGNEAHLVALWKLDEGAGTALLDGTANNFDGTLSTEVRTTRAVASGNAVTYTEDGAAVGLFSDVVVSTVESGQSITGMTFTVSNVSDATEFLTVDGQAIALTQGNTGTTTATGVTYSVSVNAGTATLSLSKTGGATPEETAALINGITYGNSSQNPSTTLPRAVTLTSMTDSGGGSATATLSLTSTVTLVAMNDAPSDIALSGTTIALGDTAQRIEVGTISVTDVDNVAHTLTLGGSDTALFEVEDGKLYLKAGTPLNPTDKPIFSVSLTADDGAAVNNTYTKAFTIGITENVAPVFSVAAVNGSQLTLVLQDSSRLDPTKVPAISAFTVSGGYTVSAVSVPDDATKTVVLTLDATPSGDITVGYTQPGSEANRLQDALGNLVASFANQAVINGSVDTSTATITVPNGGTVPAPLGDFTLINDSDIPAVVSGLRDGQTVTLSGSGPAQISAPAGSLTVANTGSGTVTVDGLNTGSTLTTTGSGPTSVTNPDGNLSVVNNGSGTVTVNGLNPDATLSTGGTGAIDLVGPEGNLILNNTGSGSVTVYGLQNGAALNVTTGTQPTNVDLSHLSSGQSITIDNDGSGVVNVFNVPEGVTVSFTGAGPVNSAPTISGIPAAAQAVVAGAAAALADFAVADANADNTLLVTLTANNGAIGGLTDNDANTPGIQLTGSAAAINSALTNATFTASNAGPASIAINVMDGVFARPTTATYSLTAAPAPAPEPDDPPAPAPAPAPIPPQNQWPKLPDGDGDGVPQSVEARVPSLVTSGSSAAPGDGNGDGIADTAQSDVSSAAFRATDAISQNPQAPVTFVTLVSNSLAGKPVGSTAITQMSQMDAPAGLPAVMEAPLGLLAFTAGVINVGDSGSFSLYVDPGLGVNGFWRQDANGTWVNLASEAYGGRMVEEGGRLRLDFVIEDGGAFDADGAANGFVSAPGAVGSMPLSLAEHQPVVENDGFWF